MPRRARTSDRLIRTRSYNPYRRASTLHNIFALLPPRVNPGERTYITQGDVIRLAVTRDTATRFQVVQSLWRFAMEGHAYAEDNYGEVLRGTRPDRDVDLHLTRYRLAEDISDAPLQRSAVGRDRNRARVSPATRAQDEFAINRPTPTFRASGGGYSPSIRPWNAPPTPPPISQIDESTDMVGAYVGPEIELMLPTNMTLQGLAARISREGIDARFETYNHGNREWWKVTTDSSLRMGNGAELVAPIIKRADAEPMLRKMFTVLDRLDMSVNPTCGMHVHVNAVSNLGWFKRLTKLYRHYESVIDSILPPERRDGHHYKSLRNWSVDVIDRARTINELVDALQARFGSNWDRDFKLNLSSFVNVRRHGGGTVEFRQHSGVVSFEKAINWVNFCLYLCDAAKEDVSYSTPTLMSLMNLIKAPSSMVEYFHARQRAFSGER